MNTKEIDIYQLKSLFYSIGKVGFINESIIKLYKKYLNVDILNSFMLLNTKEFI